MVFEHSFKHLERNQDVELLLTEEVRASELRFISHREGQQPLQNMSASVQLAICIHKKSQQREIPTDPWHRDEACSPYASLDRNLTCGGHT